MNTATTPAMIEAAKQVAEAVQATPGVLSAWADDWGQFGNFSLFVKIDASPADAPSASW